MPTTIRDATPADAALLSWVQVEAARSHRPIGFWDLALPGADQPRLGLIEQVMRSPREHFAHYSGFLVAEQDGVPIGALSGYSPAQKHLGHFIEALRGVLTANGWSDAHLSLLSLRVATVASCMSDAPQDSWIVEWVALKPVARGKGAASALLDAILERGRRAGFAKSQISVLIGNTPAERCYERAGFRFVDDKRDPAFEALIGAPGVARLSLDLGAQR